MARQSLLHKRGMLIGTVIFCSFEAVLSWTKVSTPTAFPRDLFHMFGLGFAIFITVSIATRSPSIADRVVFGAVAGAFLLILLKAAVSFSPSSMSIVEGLKASMWTVAAIASLVVLVKGLRRGTPAAISS